ncbi:MAG: hydroxyphenylacetyl-CoA thioesterase PaaI [Gammaproteobacteria bacterium]|nr:hydroxyphenylacetyl-CoA thioesterase PaaI [Gammaproteobacteria bacterium]
MSKNLTGLELARACAEKMLEDDDAAKFLDMSVDVIEPGVAEVRMSVTPHMVNGYGVCHGGYIFLLADSAFAYACNGYDDMSVAAGASIDYIAPARLGEELIAVAREAHRGRRMGVYEIEVRGPDGHLVALFRGRSAHIGRQILDPK